jgi:hypothetical protein
VLTGLFGAKTGRKAARIAWEGVNEMCEVLHVNILLWRGGRDALVLAQHYHYGPELTALRPSPTFYTC